MKKVLLLFCMIATLVSCGSKNEQWEYKVVKVAGTDAEVMADFGTLVFADQTSMLNKMGKEGWELVSTYTETCSCFRIGANQLPTFFAHFVQHGCLISKDKCTEVCHYLGICASHLDDLVFPLFIFTST